MAFVFTLTGKRRIDGKDSGEMMKGRRWALTYSFTSLSTDTTGAKNIADDVGGALQITDQQVSIDAAADVFLTNATTVVTVNKAATGGLLGHLKVEVLAR